MQNVITTRTADNSRSKRSWHRARGRHGAWGAAAPANGRAGARSFSPGGASAGALGHLSRVLCPTISLGNAAPIVHYASLRQVYQDLSSLV